MGTPATATEPVPVSTLDLVLPSGQIGPLTMIPNPMQMSPADAQAKAQLGIKYGSQVSAPFEGTMNNWKQQNLWDTLNPRSCLVAAIGNHWRARSWARVMNMIDFANKQGMRTNLIEIQDRCMTPYDALGTMRNEAILEAQRGYEFLCTVDTDVLPEPDALYRLINRMENDGRSIAVPYIDEPGTGKVLHGPERPQVVHQKYSGAHFIRWAVLSMQVYRVNVFAAFPPGTFWDNAIGSDEGFHFKKMFAVGHIPIIDTDVIVPVQSAPTYPLTTKHMKPEDAAKFWADKEAHRNAPPDRRPLNPSDPRIAPQGMYLPFWVPNCLKDNVPLTRADAPDQVNFACPKCDLKMSVPIY